MSKINRLLKISAVAFVHGEILHNERIKLRRCDSFVCVCAPGFQISGGESAGRMDLGTIISSITPGGPADVDGRLKPGVDLFRRRRYQISDRCTFYTFQFYTRNCSLTAHQHHTAY